MGGPRDELIRVDAQGVAHPIGVVASQRMRPHQGTYRVLPAPPHVIIMRFTGDDGQVDAGDGAIIRLGGEIVAAGTLCDIFALVAQTGWRGVLCVHQGDLERRVYIDQSNVLGVRSNVTEERLGRVMYRYGLIGDDDLHRVEEQVEQGKRFGEAAVELGLSTRETIYKAFTLQVTEVVVGAMHVADGTFFFLDGFDDHELSIRLAVSINALLMDGVTRMDEVRYFAEKVPSLDHVPVQTGRSEQPSPELLEVYGCVDGKTSVRQIGRLTALGEFETMKKIYGLVQSKFVVIRPPQVSGGPAAIVAAANDVLGAAYKFAETARCIPDLRDGLSQFAIGQGVFYDLLFRGAGPDENGRLDAGAVATNAPMVAEGGDVEQALRKLLFDYVCFALFSVGSRIGKEAEGELMSTVELSLSTLRPTG
jgi:hypothetical protein